MNRFGMKTVREKGEVSPTIEQALAVDGPALIDFAVEQEENVYPMVAPGAPVHDMIRRPVGVEIPPVFPPASGQAGQE